MLLLELRRLNCVAQLGWKNPQDRSHTSICCGHIWAIFCILEPRRNDREGGCCSAFSTSIHGNNTGSFLTFLSLPQPIRPSLYLTLISLQKSSLWNIDYYLISKFTATKTRLETAVFQRRFTIMRYCIRATFGIKAMSNLMIELWCFTVEQGIRLIWFHLIYIFSSPAINAMTM